MPGSVHIFIFFSSCCMTCMLFCSIVLAEQPHVEKPTPNSIGPGQSPTLTESSQTCDTFLTFTTQPPYNNLESIPLLLSSNASETNKTSPVTEYSTLESNSSHTIPITCSSSGQCDQMNSFYIIGQGDTYNSTADVIYQWLTSCQALIEQKGYNAYEDLRVGDTMPVPIRCACPTREQIHQSMAYLLTNATIPEKRTISMSRAKFRADIQRTLMENKLSSNDSYKYPNTRVLLAPGEPPSPDLGGGEPPSPDLGGDEPPSDLGGDEPPSDLGGDEPPSPDLGGDEPPSDLGGDEPPSDLGGGGSGQDYAAHAPMNELSPPTPSTSKSNNTWKYIVGPVGPIGGLILACSAYVIIIKCKLCGKVEINIFRSTKRKEEQSKAGPN